MSPLARRLRPALATLLLIASPAAAQVRGVEAEGAVPVPAQAFTAAALRAKAQEAALLEAVLQVANAMATPPAPAPDPGAPAAPAPSTPSTTPPTETPALADRVRKAFEGAAPLDFTARYRVVQDVGVRPRQLLQDPAVSQEYAVRVEAQVDSGRVRRKLAAAGLLPAPPKEAAPALPPSSFGVVVEGLPSAGALADVQRALFERTRAKQVLPTSITAREVAFAVTAGQLGEDPAATLRGPAGSALWLEPVPGGEPGAPLRLRVTDPPPLTGAGSVPPSAGASAQAPAVRPGTAPAAAAPTTPTTGAAGTTGAPRPAAPAPGSVPPSAGAPTPRATPPGAAPSAPRD